MGPLRGGLIAGLALLASCSSDAASEDASSPCVAFEKPPAPALRVEPRFTIAGVRHVVASSSQTFVVSDTKVTLTDGTTVLDVAPAALLDAVAARDGTTLTVARRTGTSVDIVQFASNGATADVASGKVLATIDGAEADGTASLAFDASGALLVATSDRAKSEARDRTSKHGKVLRLENGVLAVAAIGLHRPTVDVDPQTGDAFVVDRGMAVDEIDRLVDGDDYGWPVREGYRCTGGAMTCDEAADPMVELAGGDAPRVGDGHVVASRAGTWLYRGPDALVSVARYGPSGPPSTIAFPQAAAGRVVGRTHEGDVVVADAMGAGVVVDDARDRGPAVPATLLATKCFDAPGAIAYDVAVPLWSDGATKERAAVLPAGKKIAVRPDGDFGFPVGTVLVKTFSVDGRRVETRLLIQHGLEDWAGYTYAWRADGSDADLVVGRKVVEVSPTTRWTIPSRDDCLACHTPAAGYSLGPELRQVPHGAFDAHLAGSASPAPFDTTSTEGKARSYLHANCSGCHRDGSATGAAELDLRIDVPLAKTGLCNAPKTSTLGVAGAKILAPGDPSRSTLALRMRATDDTRMPKLASKVVDEANVAAVEAWIRGLTSCE